MKRKELVLLMTALTKGGKTTIATALCNPNYRAKMALLGDCRTEVTVDWTYDPEVNDITLTAILLNYKGVFGTDTKERISCEKFSEVLDGEEGQYLKDVFGLEKQENLSWIELEQYVLNAVMNYIKNCDADGLKRLIRNRLSNRFLRRIKVVVPPVEEFVQLFIEKNISLVLRDTRGLLDIDPEEATKVQLRTMQELGIDGIDAVLLLGTAAPFADTIKWYKNAYKSAFESVPVFIMTRPDSVSTLYDFKYGIDEEHVTVENVQEFLQLAKNGNKKGFKEFSNAYLQCYRLLEMFDIGKVNGVDFDYNYKVYNNEELRYIYPNSTTLVQNAGKSDYDSADYNSADYHLYELIVFENLKDIVKKMVEHNNFIELIYNQIKADFTHLIQSNVSVPMYPEYRKYDRNDVCDNILSGNILGPYDGIVTTEHGNVKYLGAVTSGVSTRIWLRNQIYSYSYEGPLKNPDGSDMESNIPKECRDNLVKMALFNIVEKNTDDVAYFQGYYFINRYSVRNAISNIRKNNMQGDALNNVSKEIASIVFK